MSWLEVNLYWGNLDDGPHPRPYAYPRERDEQSVNVWDMLYQMLQDNTGIQFRIYN